MSTLRVGVDLDNTIVCHDVLFHRLATEHALIDEGIAANKGAIRDHLRATDREDRWTLLQGEAYGPRFHEATAFEGVAQFFIRCREDSIPVFIVSHKTRHPFAGPPHDLHQAARRWLTEHGFFEPPISLPTDRVFLELTREDKWQRIATLGCSHFIDDLPEFLSADGFPPAVCPVLFDPADRHRQQALPRFDAWPELAPKDLTQWTAGGKPK